MTTETQAAVAPAAERGERTEIVGKVTSAKMETTIVVEVQRLVHHPKYRRAVRVGQKVRTGEPKHDSDANLADGGRQFRSAEAHVQPARRRRCGIEGRSWGHCYRFGKRSDAGKPDQRGQGCEVRDRPDA